MASGASAGAERERDDAILYEFALKGADVDEIVLAPDGSWVEPKGAVPSSKR